MEEKKHPSLCLKYLGIDTYNEAVIYMNKNCHVCRSEGFEAEARILVTLNDRSIIATLNTVEDNLLKINEASLSVVAWNSLSAKPDDRITVSHPKHIESLSYIRKKIYGHELETEEINSIINDIVTGQLSDTQMAMFIAGAADDRLNKKEVLDLTKAMVRTGQQLQWPSSLIVDKHCIGGLPGNRTTLIVVPIVAAFGLMIPKTSSRAITSPAGTADTMEVFAPVNLSLKTMREVVEKENGCIAWGGSVSLSPADDLLIRIERTMDLDSEGQLIASILSKKMAAGSTHIVIDIPIGETAKIRSIEQAENLKKYLEEVAKELHLETRIIFSDGSQPVGRGIGPALEARDVLAVLSCDKNAPQDLKERALTLAGNVLEFSSHVPLGTGRQLADSILSNGQALKKFKAICNAQGGWFDIPVATHQQTIVAKKTGKITLINNRVISQLAKLAGAPKSKAAGVELLTRLNNLIVKDEPLFTVHAESEGELQYALQYLQQRQDVIEITEIY